MSESQILRLSRRIEEISQGLSALGSGGAVLDLLKTVDGAGSGLDADTLAGCTKQQLDWKTCYNYGTDGFLITTDIPAGSNAMFVLELLGNGYSWGRNICTVVQGYNYHSDDAILQARGVALDAVFNINAFNYNGCVCFWFDCAYPYTTVTARCRTGNTGADVNRVTGITAAAEPTSGVTRKVTVTPSQVWHSGNDGAGSGLEADTVGGISASAIASGWLPLPAMTREGDNSFSCAADLAGILQAGTCIRYKQGGGYKYQAVVAVGAYSGGKTAVTTTGGADYTFAAGSALTDGYYALRTAPPGWPAWFSWSPVYTGFSGTPSGGTHYFCIRGRTCQLNIVSHAAAVSNAANFSISLPVQADGRYYYAAIPQLINNGATGASPGLAVVNPGTTRVDLYRLADGSTWTASGTKRAIFGMEYNF